MSLPLVFHDKVDSDLRSSYRWYERQRSGLGEELLGEIRKCLDRIERDPESLPVASAEARFGLVQRFPFVVYFRVLTDRVEVLAIVHGRRKSQVWRSRLN